MPALYVPAVVKSSLAVLGTAPESSVSDVTRAGRASTEDNTPAKKSSRPGNSRCRWGHLCGSATRWSPSVVDEPVSENSRPRRVSSAWRAASRSFHAVPAGRSVRSSRDSLRREMVVSARSASGARESERSTSIDCSVVQPRSASFALAPSPTRPSRPGLGTTGRLLSAACAGRITAAGSFSARTG